MVSDVIAGVVVFVVVNLDVTVVIGLDILVVVILVGALCSVVSDVIVVAVVVVVALFVVCLLYTSPSPRDKRQSRMPSSA